LPAAVGDELGERDGLVVEVECCHARGAGGDDLRPEFAQAVDRGVRVAGAFDEGPLGPVGDTVVGPGEDSAAEVLARLLDDLSGQCMVATGPRVPTASKSYSMSARCSGRTLIRRAYWRPWVSVSMTVSVRALRVTMTCPG